MARESIKARQKKREQMVARYAEKRKHASPVRLRNRCKLTGRPRGYIRTFGICRNVFRQMANDGKIPGVTKSSW
jgi:small subunit ribosomal protein S14